MAFTFSDWKKRISRRNDITGMVTHLTRSNKQYNEKPSEDDINRDGVDNLIKILEDKKLKGGNGFIVGHTPAVCFQDAPLVGIIQNVENEIENRIQNQYYRIRYCGVGLCFSKYYVYRKGGRPVIYDNTEEATKYLPEDEHWRIVNLQLTVEPPVTIDWTHEREWRIPNEFEFEYNLTHVILYDKDSYDYFRQKCDKKIIDELHGITILKSMIM